MTTKTSVSLLVLALTTVGCAFEGGEDVAEERDVSSYAESNVPQIEAPGFPASPEWPDTAELGDETSFDDVPPSVKAKPGTSFDDVPPKAPAPEPGSAFDDVPENLPGPGANAAHDYEPSSATGDEWSGDADDSAKAQAGEAASTYDIVEPSAPSEPKPGTYDDVPPQPVGVPCFQVHPSKGEILMGLCQPSK